MKYKIVVVTPSGRRKTQEILLNQLLLNTSVIDEYLIWVNTNVESDINWLKNISYNYSFIRLVFKDKVGGIHNINQFFETAIDQETIYIRLDDDIVFLDNDFFENIIRFRVENPQYFLILGNIINNGICNYIHQQYNTINLPYKLDNECMGNSWKEPTIAYDIHNQFIDNYHNNLIDKYKFEDKIEINKRFSINSICWFGKDMRNHYKIIAKTEDEEEYLTSIVTKNKNINNCICGKALCSHYAYCTQKEFLDKTNILKEYKQILQINTMNRALENLDFR